MIQAPRRPAISINQKSGRRIEILGATATCTVVGVISTTLIEASNDACTEAAEDNSAVSEASSEFNCEAEAGIVGAGGLETVGAATPVNVGVGTGAGVNVGAAIVGAAIVGAAMVSAVQKPLATVGHSSPTLQQPPTAHVTPPQISAQANCPL